MYTAIIEISNRIINIDHLRLKNCISFHPIEQNHSEVFVFKNSILCDLLKNDECITQKNG